MSSTAKLLTLQSGQDCCKCGRRHTLFTVEEIVDGVRKNYCTQCAADEAEKDPDNDPRSIEALRTKYRSTYVS